MQHTLWFLAGIILVLTYYWENDELFITKLAHRWYMFTLSVLNLHLWARGNSWKMSVLHIAAVLVAFNPIRHGVLDLRLGLGGHIVPPLIFRATG